LVAHFAELTTNRSDQDQHRVQSNGRCTGTYIQEDEIRGMDVHLGIEGTNSNGHGEGRDENMNMVETIKNLQKDVPKP
jgi:hypothetical protein